MFLLGILLSKSKCPTKHLFDPILSNFSPEVKRQLKFSSPLFPISMGVGVYTAEVLIAFSDAANYQL